jgi:hypothetical protein
MFALVIVSSSATGTNAAPRPAKSIAATGSECDDWRPYRLGVTPAASGTLVIACGSYYLTRISLRNVSNTILSVTLPGQTTEWRVVDPLAISFGARAALAAIPGGCYRHTRVCNVPSGSTVYAVGSRAMSLRFSVQYGNTIKANSARFLGQWIENRHSSPGTQLLGKVVACATGAKELAEQHPDTTWEDALRRTVTGYLSCSDLIRTVTRSEVTTASQRVPVARQVVRLGKVFAGGSWVDQLTYLAARIIRR